MVILKNGGFLSWIEQLNKKDNRMGLKHSDILFKYLYRQTNTPIFMKLVNHLQARIVCLKAVHKYIDMELFCDYALRMAVDLQKNDIGMDQIMEYGDECFRMLSTLDSGDFGGKSARLCEYFVQIYLKVLYLMFP